MSPQPNRAPEAQGPVPPAPVVAPDPVDGRRLHYGEFYGLRELPDDDRPVLTVIGNCQAESLRVLLAGSGQVTAARVPAVFELQPDEIGLVRALLGRTDILVTQPVRDDYRGLPLGSAQLGAMLKPGGRTVLVPSYRYAALYPWQVEARSAHGDPPVVPYLDLRTLLEAATGSRPEHRAPAEGIRRIREASVEALAERERRYDTVVQSDLIVPAGVDAAHVVNHPGNSILIGTARRVQERVGLPVDAADPGRTLLREVFAPLEEEVIDALGLDAEPRRTWTWRGEALDDEQVREAQLAWLADKPDVVAANLDRHRNTLQALGLA